MTNSKRILTLAMAVVMLMTLAVTANGLVVGNPAGVYGTVGGLQGWTNGEDVVTTTTVTKNPDNAYLKSTVDMYIADGTKIRTTDQESDYGVTKFHTTHAFAIYIDETPSCVWVAHEVKGGANEYVYSVRLAYTG